MGIVGGKISLLQKCKKFTTGRCTQGNRKRKKSSLVEKSVREGELSVGCDPISREPENEGRVVHHFERC